MRPPAVSVVPWPDESIPSMLWRLEAVTRPAAEALQIKSFRTLYEDSSHPALGRLASFLGVTKATLRNHTLQGRLGPAYTSLGWREHRSAGRLGCPGCGYQTVWTRLVLVSACPACGALLSDDGHPRGLAPEAARDLQTTYVDALLANKIGEQKRIALFWRLLSFHLCTGWSPGNPGFTAMPLGTDLGRPRELPWRQPDWIASFATIAWPATTSTRSFREHIKHVTIAAILPSTPQPIEGDEEYVDAQRARLHHQIRGSGLDERHIPDHLLAYPLETGLSALDGCHIEAIGYAISRAMRREVVLAHSGHRLSKEELIAGRGQLRQSREIAAINQLLAEDADGLRILRLLASRLIATTGPRVDYQQRRATLATVRAVPSHVLHRLSAPVRERQVAARVRADSLARDAAAWLWMKLGGGVLHHSPHHAAGRRRLALLDRLLAPEDRMALLEYGHHILGAVAADVAEQHSSVAAQHAGGDGQRRAQADAI